jgi:hypothetical protein
MISGLRIVSCRGDTVLKASPWLCFGDKQIRTSRMDETDKLVAAVYAATMTARLHIAKVEDFLGYYDNCLDAMRRRGSVDGVTAPDRTLDTFWRNAR